MVGRKDERGQMRGGSQARHFVGHPNGALEIVICTEECPVEHRIVHASKVSDRKLRANRKNARKSTGPITSDGKVASAGNAVKHGAYSTAAAVVGGVLAEDGEQIKRLEEALHAGTQATTPLRAQAVGTIARAMVALERLDRYQAKALSQAGQAPPALHHVADAAALWEELEAECRVFVAALEQDFTERSVDYECAARFAILQTEDPENFLIEGLFTEELQPQDQLGWWLVLYETVRRRWGSVDDALAWGHRSIDGWGRAIQDVVRDIEPMAIDKALYDVLPRFTKLLSSQMSMLGKAWTFLERVHAFEEKLQK